MPSLGEVCGKSGYGRTNDRTGLEKHKTLVDKANHCTEVLLPNKQAEGSGAGRKQRGKRSRTGDNAGHIKMK
jgi:hypothetical protein